MKRHVTSPVSNPSSCNGRPCAFLSDNAIWSGSGATNPPRHSPLRRLPGRESQLVSSGSVTREAHCGVFSGGVYASSTCLSLGSRRLPLSRWRGAGFSVAQQLDKASGDWEASSTLCVSVMRAYCGCDPLPLQRRSLLTMVCHGWLEQVPFALISAYGTVNRLKELQARVLTKALLG